MDAIQQNTLSRWTAEQIALVADFNGARIPLITAADVAPILPEFQLWDLWPIQHPDGRTVDFNGAEGWVIMAAPRDLHPDARHDVARLRLLTLRDGQWTDCGFLMPEGHAPGSREWAGSTTYDAATATLTLFFTATGRRGDTGHSFEQRLFQASARVTQSGDVLTTHDWTPCVESFAADGVDYVVVNEGVGTPGFIKAFRDPFHFRDPKDGRDYILFSGSLAQSDHAFNGCVGIARADGAGFADWQILPPLVGAAGVNNEMERAMMRCVDGRYYLFWSTQAKTFAPEVTTGPTGLYGMVADSLMGPYMPLNGHGLVAANPVEEPEQTYSWWVCHDLSVIGFVNHWGMKGEAIDASAPSYTTQFAGVPSPKFRLALDGASAKVMPL